MFETKVPIYLADLAFKIDRAVEDRPRVVVCSCVIQPFTRELADDVAPGVAGRLFTRDGEPAPDLLSAKVAVSVPLQRVRWYDTPDSPRPVLDLADTTVGRDVRVRKDGETPHYAGTFSLQFPYPTAKELLTLANRVNTQFWLEFEAQQVPLELDTTNAPADDEQDD